MSTFVTRWTFRLSLIALVVAIYLRYKQHPLDSGSTSEVYCYEGGVTTRWGGGGDVQRTQCFSVSDGVFTEVHDAAAPREVTKHAGHVIPGIWDGHGHLLQYGEYLHSIDLFGTTTFEEVVKRVVSYVEDHNSVGTEDNWVRGIGWDQNALGSMPTADKLAADPRLRDLYIMLDRIDVHCIWVSHAVLQLLPKHLPDIPGGEIIRDPPGMGVFCDNAMDLVWALWPQPDKTRKKEFVKSAMASLHSVGLVGMHDASVMPTQLEIYGELSKTDDWTLRMYAMAECETRNTFCADELPHFGDTGGMLTLRSVKLFADGALGSWGSALLEPYSDRPDASGSLLMNASTLMSLTKQWSAAGYQVNIHGIGDLANRLIIGAMEAALLDLCPGEMLSACQAQHRFRIEHSQIVSRHDQARMHSMGLIPSIQPTHATSDMKYAEKRLGTKRLTEEGYRMRSFLDLKPVLGSDFPVEPPSPFEGIYAAVTRKSPLTGKGVNGSESGWHIEQTLTLRQAMIGFTEGVAHGAFMEGKVGVILPGAYADWVVLDKPLEDYDIEDLRTLKVKETWVAGKRVYARVTD